MPASPNAPVMGRYIVRARGPTAALAAFIDSIRDDPDIVLVDTIGPAGQAHTAVVDIAPGQVAQFERRFLHSDELIVERDQPLSLSD